MILSLGMSLLSLLWSVVSKSGVHSSIYFHKMTSIYLLNNILVSYNSVYHEF